MITFGIALSDKSIQIIDFNGRLIYDQSVDSTMPLFNKRTICAPKNGHELLYRIFKKSLPLSKRLFTQKQIFITINPKDGEWECRVTKDIFQSLKWRYSPILVPFSLASLIGLESNPTGQELIIDIDDRNCYISFFNGMNLLKFEETELEINAILREVNSIIKTPQNININKAWLIGRNENLNDFLVMLRNSLNLSIKLSHNPQNVTINGLNRIMKYPELYLTKSL